MGKVASAEWRKAPGRDPGHGSTKEGGSSSSHSGETAATCKANAKMDQDQEDFLTVLFPRASAGHNHTGAGIRSISMGKKADMGSRGSLPEATRWHLEGSPEPSSSNLLSPQLMH